MALSKISGTTGITDGTITSASAATNAFSISIAAALG